MQRLLVPFAFLSLILSGAIFGFFYAWVCSTMWGLDAIDPRVAIQAMNGMNASVRNGVFAAAFFGSPAALALTALLALAARRKAAALSFASGAVVYTTGGLILTMTVHVPLNEALAQIAVPDTLQEAQEIWTSYSPNWQYFNVLRTLVSGGTLLLAGIGTLLIPINR